MDLFSAPSWDDGDVCEKINNRLIGSGAESTVSTSNKKSRKAAKKMAKLEKSQLADVSQEDVSVKDSNHLDSLKKDLLSELKCKFAKKRKSASSNAEEDIISPPPIKRKKVTFNNEAEVVLIDSTKPVHVSPKKKKKEKKQSNKPMDKEEESAVLTQPKKKKEKRQSNKPTDNEEESATLNQPSGKLFKFSSLLAKISKKLDKLDEKELEEKQANGVVGNNSSKKISSKPNSVNGETKKTKKKKLKVSKLPTDSVEASECTPGEVVNISPKSAKQKKKKPSASGGNGLESKKNAAVNKPSVTLAEKKLSMKAKKKLKKQRKKLKLKGLTAEGVKTAEPKTPIENVSALSPPMFSNANQQKLQGSLAQAEPTPTPSTETQPEEKSVVRRPPKSLRERMMRKLHASRFRYLNEQMYLSKGNESLEYFKTDPQAFQAYHQGYRQQVEQWPLNPLDKIINMLKKKPQLVVADFGCGDARLARSIPNKVHSFDLVALSELVTACDMAHTPLGNATVDMAVFCLSLMGTNLNDYLKEANRVLKQGGSLKIAEVESRFDDIDLFIKNVQKYGFDFVNKDLSNELFYFMDFHKVENISNKQAKLSALPTVSLRPCYYKKR